MFHVTTLHHQNKKVMSDTRDYIMECLKRERGKVVCTDEAFTYYSLFVDGRALLYRRATLRPDSRRAFYLTDQLAAVLGFCDIYTMSYKLNGLQYWRRFVSPERLQKALDKYRHKWGVDVPFIE